MYTLDMSLDAVRLTRERLRRVGQQLAEIAEPFASGPGRIGGSWQGRAADQVRAEMTGLAGRVRHAADLLAGSSRVVSDFELAGQQALDDVAVLNRRVGSAQDEHAAQLATVSRTQSFLSADGGGGPQAVARARAAAESGRADADADLSRVLRHAQTEYEEILARLRTAAARMGTGLAEATIAPVPTAVAAGYHGGPVTPAELALLREAALAELRPALALTTARHQGGWDLFTTREQAEAEASRLAGSVDRSLDAGQAPSAQDVAALARYGHNHWFASAFITRVGPAGLVRMDSRIESMVTAYPDTHPLATAQQVDQVRDGARALMGAVAGTFTTAAGPTQDAGDASPHDSGPPDGYARAMAEAGTADVESGYSLSVLLHLAGNVDPAAALTLATGVYDAQRADPGARTWATQDDPTVLGSRPHDLFGHPEWADPMTGAAELLARDPATAQTFLLGPDAPHPGHSSPADPTAVHPATSRLHHLTTARDWTGSDGGTAYGHLLEAATTTLRDHDGTDSPGYRSAQIAATYLHHLPTDLPEALKPATGHILAAYINDVQRSQTRTRVSEDVYTRDDTSLPGQQAYGINLGWAESNRSLRSAVGNEDAFRSVMAAERALTQQQLDYAAGRLAHPPDGVSHDKLDDDWNNTISNGALLWGTTVDAANLAHIKAGEAADARAHALLDLASTATSTLPTPGGKAVQFAFTQARSHVFSQFSSYHEADERLAAVGTVPLANQTMFDMVAVAATNNHLFDEEAVYSGRQHYEPTSSPGYYLDDDGHIVSRNQMTPEQDAAYQEWAGRTLWQQKQVISTSIEKGITDY